MEQRRSAVARLDQVFGTEIRQMPKDDFAAVLAPPMGLRRFLIEQNGRHLTNRHLATESCVCDRHRRPAKPLIAALERPDALATIS